MAKAIYNITNLEIQFPSLYYIESGFRKFMLVCLPQHLHCIDGAAVLPGQVGKLRVHRTGNNFSVDCMELVHTVAECNDLCGADKCAAKYTRAFIKIYFVA